MHPQRGMAPGTLILLLVVSLGTASCSSLFPGANPPLYYTVDHPRQDAPCPSGFHQGLRVWPFSASAPFDRQEMIVSDPSREVRFSPRFRWVVPPSGLLSDAVVRDLGQSGLFSGVVGAPDVLDAPLEMGGHVFRFAWEEKGSLSRAVLEVEVSLWSREPRREVVFHRSYSLEGEPTTARGAERFADAMSRLVQRFTAELQQDLCGISTRTGNSSPAGG